MANMNQDIANKFCDAANWAFVVWITRRTLFEGNKDIATTLGKSPAFCERLSIITQEYALLQIAKLHDNAKLGKSRNLSIDYMVKFGDWGKKKPEMERLAARLSDFWNKIATVRNKVLAHNDLDAMLTNELLGMFDDGEDEEYFKALQEFVDIVHDEWCGGGPRTFDDLAEMDTKEFLDLIRG